MRYVLLLVITLGLFGPAFVTRADEKGEEAASSTDEAAKEKTLDFEKLTLERLFPEKSFFGPSARRMAFSRDGRYAAYLYRPYIERRHGSDLWIYDVETGEAKRITKVSVLSEFQESARKVREDRIKKAKKRRGKETAGEKPVVEAPLVDDGVSGEWQGHLQGDEESGLPPEGLSFTLTIMVAEDQSVSGTLSTAVADATITEGTFDPETKRLDCTLVNEEAELTATLNVTIEDGAMEGELVVVTLETTLTVSGTHAASLIELEKREEEVEKTEQQEQLEEEEQDEEGEADHTDTTGTQDGEQENKHEEDEQNLGDIVDEKDAEDEKAPRYGGVSSFVWAPEANELIFTSGGDLYRYIPETAEITRLTITRDSERDVQYLPDGSGYTHLSGNSLLKVSFSGHLLEQLDPKLPAGETMSGYRLSPDGTRLVLLTSKGDNFWGRGRTVNIVNYRDRFAQVRQVTRHVSDDPLPDFEWSVYLYDLSKHRTEEGELGKVYSHKQSGPRDIMQVPEWAPDSSRVAFAVFEQSTGHVEILEAVFPEIEKDDAEDEAKPEEEPAAGENKADEEESEDPEAVEEEAEEKEIEFEDAKAVYRFLHNGGPNTPAMIHPYYLADSRRLVFITEQSGFRHLHVLDPLYESLSQLTRGNFEVYTIDISKDHKRMFVASTREDPAQQHVYTVDLGSGEMARLTTREGYYSSAAVSEDGAHALANFVDFGTLRELVAIDAAKEEAKTLTDSHPEEASILTQPVPEYFTYKNRHGHEIHGHMFKPADWTPDDKRPLLIYVYGGPLGTSKMVTRGSFSAPSYFFAYYMAMKHGYITCTIDPRGASGYGGLFEKSNYEQVGKPQVEDLVDGARWFIENVGVDPERVGLHGWSFGGFQTQMCLYTEPDVFACGIAGAGPTEWENYNSWYSQGTIGPTREGKADLKEFSLLPLTKNLKAKLLLVHGMEDSNVLYQDTVRVYRELLKAGKETLVELFLDPTGGHGLGGDVKTINRYRKYEEFLLRCLGTGEPAVKDEPAAEEPVEGEQTPAEETADPDGEAVSDSGAQLGIHARRVAA